MWCLAEAHSRTNQWIAYFTSTENRHALPLFTSLLNVVCAYDPVGYGMPYNHLMFTDSREPLVEVALHVLCATLEGSEPAVAPSDVIAGTANVKPANEVPTVNNYSRVSFAQTIVYFIYLKKPSPNFTCLSGPEVTPFPYPGINITLPGNLLSIEAYTQISDSQSSVDESCTNILCTEFAFVFLFCVFV